MSFNSPLIRSTMERLNKPNVTVNVNNVQGDDEEEEKAKRLRAQQEMINSGMAIANKLTAKDRMEAVAGVIPEKLSDTGRTYAAYDPNANFGRYWKNDKEGFVFDEYEAERSIGPAYPLLDNADELTEKFEGTKPRPSSSVAAEEEDYTTTVR